MYVGRDLFIRHLLFCQPQRVIDASVCVLFWVFFFLLFFVVLVFFKSITLMCVCVSGCPRLEIYIYM